MKQTLVIVVLSLILGIIGGAIIQGKFSKPKNNGITLFEEVVKIKELHLIKHVYQDISFIHKKNDPNKPVRAIAIVPVSISSYIDLKNMRVEYKNDSISKIILPLPQLNEPNYQTDKMEIKSLRNFQIHFGKDLYSEVLIYFKYITSKRKLAIRQLSIKNGILEETKEEAKEYIMSLLKGLKLGAARIEFDETSGFSENESHDIKIGELNNQALYNPELIPVVNIKE